MRRLLVILASFSALLFASPLSATNYFVTESGAGSQNGLSLANAWSLANYNASSVPTGGDTVFFSGTITTEVFVSTSGTGNGASRLTLDFTGTCAGCSTVILAAPGRRVDLNNKSFITLQGNTTSKTVLTSVSGATQFNAQSETGHDITIDSFTYTGPAGGTPDFYQNGFYTFVTISNNFGDNLSHLVNSYQGSVHDFAIRNNFGRTSTDTTTDDDVIQLSDAVNVLIEGNKLIDQAPGSTCCHNDVIQTFQSGSTNHQHPSNWIIRYNWIESAQVAGGGGNESFMELQNFAGQPALQVYGNVFVGTGVTQSGGNGISLHSGTNASDTYYFYNNTVWRHQMPLNPIRLGEGDGPGTLFFRNNVAGNDTTGQGIQATFSAGATWDYNYFYQYSNCTSTFTGSNGSCSLTPTAFVSTTANNFSAAISSVFINAGDSSIGAAYNQGIAPGATWPNPALNTRFGGAWDAGAFQQGTTASVNPPANLTVTVQ
jgi:hypothetical protein